MTSSPKHDSSPGTTARITEQARHAAAAGDRWFVSLASNLGGIGEWAQSEATVVVESFSAALHTTREVTKKIVRLNVIDDRQETDVSTPAVVASPDTAEIVAPIIPDSLLAEAPNSEVPSNLDLLAATSDASCSQTSTPEEPKPESSEAGYFPGVLPLVQALERIIREHACSGNRSLQRDSRFWRLIQLLHLLRPPQPEADGDTTTSDTPSTIGVIK